jgi:tetratricopeptide (TPR) repeat protein
MRARRVKSSLASLSLVLACASKPAGEPTPTVPGAEPVVFIEAPTDPQARRPVSEQPAEQVRQTPVASAEDLEHAKLLFSEGLERYEAGDIAGAIEHFETAYQIAPLPALQFNIARGKQQLGDVVGACAAYGGLLANPEIDENLREHASREAERLGC